MVRKKSTDTSVGGERRQRRFEERDARIQAEATRLFMEHGLAEFSMDDVASAIDYSKGTVYQHYQSKEDVLVTVLLRHLEEVTVKFEQAATAPVCPRARMRAMAELDLAHTIAFPEVLPLSMTFIVPATLAKAPPEKDKAVQDVYTRNNATEAGIIREAISRGDLTLPPGRKPDWIRYVISAMHFGSMFIATQGTPSRSSTLAQMSPLILANVEAAMDGLQWKPLAASPEYVADVERLRGILFGKAGQVLHVAG